MNFGASPSDINIVVSLCKSLYRRSAGGEYDEISREVRALHTVLRHLKYEVEDHDSPLNRDQSIWGRQLAPIIGDCGSSLGQLDELFTKYGRLSKESGGSAPRSLRDQARLGNDEMDQLGAIRVKLISHKTSLTLFLDKIQLHQSGKMATTLDNQGGQLDVILDKVDKIAARMGQKSGTIMTSYDNDDAEVWKQFRRELVAEGFSSDVLQQNKDVLRAYIREIDQKGLLDEEPTDPQMSPPPIGNHTERWLQNVQAPPVVGSPAVVPERPPSFDSLNSPAEPVSPKERVIEEENMKFPLSMKMERPRPESRREGLQMHSASSEDGSHEGRKLSNTGSSKAPSMPTPKVVTSDKKQQFFVNTDGSSEDDSESDTSSSDSGSSSHGQIITTSKLVSLSQALTIHRPESPLSFKSQGSYLEDAPARSMAHRPKQLEYGVSPSQPGAVKIPTPASKDRLGTSLRVDPVHLAPDSHGKEIPSDAKWTKISRRLVSPEVLNQDRRRYEARPEFVAVLGVLSRAEIQDLAARSDMLREARRKRYFPPETLPPKPPRPQSIPVHAARPGRDTPSEEASESSDSNTRRRRNRSRNPHSNSKNNYTYQQQPPSQQYAYAKPTSFGAPLSPALSYVSTKQQAGYTSQSQPAMWTPMSPQPDQRSYPQREDEYPSRKEKSTRRKHRSSSKPLSGKDDEQDIPQREREKNVRKGRWKENLTSAGIGGAAVSLFHVLSEAAEGL